MKKIFALPLIIVLFSLKGFATGHTVTITSTNVTCNGQCNGTANAIVTGGVGPFYYSWSMGATSSSINGLCISNYIVTVTDNNDLSIATSSVTITEPSAVTVTVSTTPATCGQSNGTAVATTSGGFGSYTYSWSSTATGQTASGLTSGAYTVTVTDAKGCWGTAFVIINNIGSPVTTVSTQNVKCKNNYDGSAIVNISGGSAPYTYFWSPTGITTQTALGLNAGAYTVSVTDGNNCSSTNTAIITEPPSIIVKVDTTLLRCTGIVIASASGGTGNFTYMWNQGAQGQTVNLAVPGTYTLTVTDFNGCSKTVTTIVQSVAQQLTGVNVVETIFKESCWSTGDGAINLTLSGPNAVSLLYKWSNTATQKDINNLLSGSYYVEIYNSSMSNCLTKTYNVPIDGTNCGNVSGNIFIDDNSNCSYTAGEKYFPNAIVTANPGNRASITDQNGNYTFNNMAYNTYTISHTGTNLIAPSCISSQNATVSAGNQNIINVNFADTTSTKVDVQVTASCSAVVPGFAGIVNIYLNNLLPSLASGTLKAVLPPGFSTVITTASPSGYTLSGDTLIWNYNNVSTTYINFQIDFTTPVNTTLGSIFKCCSKATVTGYDVNLANNTSCTEAIVRGSFDPNDKAVSPIGEAAQGGITLADKDLTYLIRCQNTGNGPAVNIMVKDTLSAKLDISTLQMIRASHNYILDILPGNVLRWRFNNIMLVDSGTNEPASHGSILYRIKQKSGNQVGDVIKNTAYIYFDFNEAVVTNTTVSKIVWPLAINEFASENGNVMVYPNPFSDVTTFVIQTDKVSGSYSFEITDLLGKRVESMNGISGNQFQISRKDLQNGIYFYKIYTTEKVIDIGKVIIE